MHPAFSPPPSTVETPQTSKESSPTPFLAVPGPTAIASASPSRRNASRSPARTRSPKFRGTGTITPKPSPRVGSPRSARGLLTVGGGVGGGGDYTRFGLGSSAPLPHHSPRSSPSPGPLERKRCLSESEQDSRKKHQAITTIFVKEEEEKREHRGDMPRVTVTRDGGKRELVVDSQGGFVVAPVADREVGRYHEDTARFEVGDHSLSVSSRNDQLHYQSPSSTTEGRKIEVSSGPAEAGQNSNVSASSGPSVISKPVSKPKKTWQFTVDEDGEEVIIRPPRSKKHKGGKKAKSDQRGDGKRVSSVGSVTKGLNEREGQQQGTSKQGTPPPPSKGTHPEKPLPPSNLNAIASPASSIASTSTRLAPVHASPHSVSTAAGVVTRSRASSISSISSATTAATITTAHTSFTQPPPPPPPQEITKPVPLQQSAPIPISSSTTTTISLPDAPPLPPPIEQVQNLVSPPGATSTLQQTHPIPSQDTPTAETCPQTQESVSSLPSLRPEDEGGSTEVSTASAQQHDEAEDHPMADVSPDMPSIQLPSRPRSQPPVKELVGEDEGVRKSINTQICPGPAAVQSTETMTPSEMEGVQLDKRSRPEEGQASGIIQVQVQVPQPEPEPAQLAAAAQEAAVSAEEMSPAAPMILPSLDQQHGVEEHGGDTRMSSPGPPTRGLEGEKEEEEEEQGEGNSSASVQVPVSVTHTDAQTLHANIAISSTAHAHSFPLPPPPPPPPPPPAEHQRPATEQSLPTPAPTSTTVTLTETPLPPPVQTPQRPKISSLPVASHMGNFATAASSRNRRTKQQAQHTQSVSSPLSAIRTRHQRESGSPSAAAVHTPTRTAVSSDASSSVHASPAPPQSHARKDPLAGFHELDPITPISPLGAYQPHVPQDVVEKIRELAGKRIKVNGKFRMAVDEDEGSMSDVIIMKDESGKLASRDQAEVSSEEPTSSSETETDEEELVNVWAGGHVKGVSYREDKVFFSKLRQEIREEARVKAIAAKKKEEEEKEKGKGKAVQGQDAGGGNGGNSAPKQASWSLPPMGTFMHSALKPLKKNAIKRSRAAAAAAKRKAAAKAGRGDDTDTDVEMMDAPVSQPPARPSAKSRRTSMATVPPVVDDPMDLDFPTHTAPGARPGSRGSGTANAIPHTKASGAAATASTPSSTPALRVRPVRAATQKPGINYVDVPPPPPPVVTASTAQSFSDTDISSDEDVIPARCSFAYTTAPQARDSTLAGQSRATRRQDRLAAIRFTEGGPNGVGLRPGSTSIFSIVQSGSPSGGGVMGPPSGKVTAAEFRLYWGRRGDPVPLFGSGGNMVNPGLGRGGKMVAPATATGGHAHVQSSIGGGGVGGGSGGDVAAQSALQSQGGIVEVRRVVDPLLEATLEVRRLILESKDSGGMVPGKGILEGLVVEKVYWSGEREKSLTMPQFGLGLDFSGRPLVKGLTLSNPQTNHSYTLLFTWAFMPVNTPDKNRENAVGSSLSMSDQVKGEGAKGWGAEDVREAFQVHLCVGKPGRVQKKEDRKRVAFVQVEPGAGGAGKEGGREGERGKGKGRKEGGAAAGAGSGAGAGGGSAAGAGAATHSMSSPLMGFTAINSPTGRHVDRARSASMVDVLAFASGGEQSGKPHPRWSENVRWERWELDGLMKGLTRLWEEACRGHDQTREADDDGTAASGGTTTDGGSSTIGRWLERDVLGLDLAEKEYLDTLTGAKPKAAVPVPPVVRKLVVPNPGMGPNTVHAGAGSNRQQAIQAGARGGAKTAPGSPVRVGGGEGGMMQQWLSRGSGKAPAGVGQKPQQQQQARERFAHAAGEIHSTVPIDTVVVGGGGSGGGGSTKQQDVDSTKVTARPPVPLNLLLGVWSGDRECAGRRRKGVLWREMWRGYDDEAVGGGEEEGRLRRDDGSGNLVWGGDGQGRVAPGDMFWWEL